MLEDLSFQEMEGGRDGRRNGRTNGQTEKMAPIYVAFGGV